FIAIEHKDGPYSVYKHRLAAHVDVGDVVERGQVIGQVGSSQAPRVHLHYDEQATLVDFNRPGNRLPLGPMYYWSGGRRRAPGSIGGATEWSGLPRGTRITSTAWRTGWPLGVSTPRQFRSALAGLGTADRVGPFVIRLEADIPLSGGPLEYRGDDLLIVLGRRFSLRRDNGCRVIETIGPLELNNVRLGPAQGGCAAVFSTRLVTVVGNGIHPRQLDAGGGATFVSS
ncbi:MAG TPA: M23 family metallopeptidase, partial [Acidimicrobiales bacterium]|nr:M23 family metallopeptidase [Acidimicrobiales bacterium]